MKIVKPTPDIEKKKFRSMGDTWTFEEAYEILTELENNNGCLYFTPEDCEDDDIYEEYMSLYEQVLFSKDINAEGDEKKSELLNNATKKYENFLEEYNNSCLYTLMKDYIKAIEDWYLEDDFGEE